MVRRDRSTPPIAPMPTSIIAQEAGSGTSPPPPLLEMPPQSVHGRLCENRSPVLSVCCAPGRYFSATKSIFRSGPVAREIEIAGRFDVKSHVRRDGDRVTTPKLKQVKPRICRCSRRRWKPARRPVVIRQMLPERFPSPPSARIRVPNRRNIRAERERVKECRSRPTGGRVLDIERELVRADRGDGERGAAVVQLTYTCRIEATTKADNPSTGTRQGRYGR